MATILADVTALVNAAVGWVGQFVTVITGQPLLLMFVIVAFVGLGVGTGKQKKSYRYRGRIARNDVYKQKQRRRMG